MDRLVQFASEAFLDASTRYDWADLAMHLSDHHRDIRIRILSGVANQVALAGRNAIRNQPDRQSDVYTDPVRAAQFAAGRS